MMRLVIWILRLYPPAWRERYEAEMTVLLEQHAITCWTILDLLWSALDARLDPYYRRTRALIPLTPWQQLQNSWSMMLAAFVVFWLTQLLWLCGGGLWSPLSFVWPTTADAGMNLGALSYLSLPLIFTALVGWIGWQGGKNSWNLLHLLPVALFVQLLLLSPWVDGWQNALLWVFFLGALILIASNVGKLLTSLRRWERRPNLPLAYILRGLAFVGILAMTWLCCMNMAWMQILWKAYWSTGFSDYWWYGPVSLTLEFITMMLATLLAAIGLLRSCFDLQEVRRLTPAQATRSRESASSCLFENSSPLPEQSQGRVDPRVWMVIVPLLAGVLLLSSVVIASFAYLITTVNASSMLVASLLMVGCLASLLVAITVRKGRQAKVSLFHQEKTLLVARLS